MPQHSQPHYRVDYDGSTLRLEIPSRKHWLQIAFIVILVIFWTLFTLGFLNSIALPQISSTIPTAGNLESFLAHILVPGLFGLFGLIWLVTWLLSGLYAVYLVLWQLIGKDVIEINALAIRIRRKVMGFERPIIYPASNIRNLRVSPLLIQSNGRENYPAQFWLQNLGTLAFDDGAKTIRFGDLDKAEARKALADIIKRFPGYRLPTP